MAYMTREEMIGVIRSGQTVIHKGRLLVTEADVPSEGDLAQGDPAKIQAARKTLEARKRAIDLELAALEAPIKPEPTAKATDEVSVDPAPEKPADLKSPPKGK
jgi:hypothetical protein